jgi:hypothetical protein
MAKNIFHHALIVSDPVAFASLHFNKIESVKRAGSVKVTSWG